MKFKLVQDKTNKYSLAATSFSPIAQKCNFLYGGNNLEFKYAPVVRHLYHLLNFSHLRWECVSQFPSVLYHPCILHSQFRRVVRLEALSSMHRNKMQMSAQVKQRLVYIYALFRSKNEKLLQLCWLRFTGKRLAWMQLHTHGAKAVCIWERECYCYLLFVVCCLHSWYIPH